MAAEIKFPPVEHAFTNLLQQHGFDYYDAITQHVAAYARAAVELNRVVDEGELETMRQWFDSLQDVNGGYLTPADYVLASKLYALCNMQVPYSISRVAAAALAKE